MSNTEWKRDDICYFVSYDVHSGARIEYGIVDYLYDRNSYHPGFASISYLMPRDGRKVNGIPIKEFQSETDFKKLPKGWSYDTKLFDLTWEPLPLELKDVKLDDPEAIKDAFTKGILVRASDIFIGRVESEIIHGEYRIVKKPPMRGTDPVTNTRAALSGMFRDFASAVKEKERLQEEKARIAAMSDLEYSISEMEKTLERYKSLYPDRYIYVTESRQFLLTLPNFEDVVTRICDGKLQWKYDRSREWTVIT